MTRYAPKKQISPEKLQQILETGGRIPPQAQEMEEAVLGSVMMEEKALSTVLEALRPDDFYNPGNRLIFESIERLYNKSDPVDMITLEDDLKERGVLEKAGGAGTLTQLTSAVPSTANVAYYAEIVREKSVLRKIILANTEISAQAYETDVDTWKVLDAMEEKTFEISHSVGGTEKAPDFVSGLMETIDELKELRDAPEGITGVPIGISSLEKYTGGWQRGDLAILAGRPSMGKTGLMLSTVLNAAKHPNPYLRTGSAVFSLEMPRKSLISRLIAMENDIDVSKMRKGQLTDDEFGKILENSDEQMRHYNIIVDDTATSMREIRSRTREYIQRYGIGIIFVDYIQLMEGTGDEGNREQEIAGISRGLKRLAKEFDIPVIALSQLNRAVEMRGDKKPMLSDLRESGQIEQDADLVGFVWRPEYYNIEMHDGQSTENIAYVIIGKQRNGPVGQTRMNFYKKTTQFRDLAWNDGFPEAGF